MSDLTTKLQQQIDAALNSKTPLRICGNNTKSFYGNRCDGETISTHEHTGILSYDASELVMKVRSGTTLKEIEETLDRHNQMLPFEPNSFSGDATIGGTIACNTSGPARAYRGAARDFVLGTSIINGQAEVLSFGGQVMKNVAGYDASRLMTGALGTLGLLLDISIKVLPKTSSEKTIAIPQSVQQSITTINTFSTKNLPISASCWFDGTLFIRISSSEKNTNAVVKKICTETGGDIIENDSTFWQSVREQQHHFFNAGKKIARLSLPATADSSHIQGEQFIEWGGALRWICSDSSIEMLRQQATELGGHATAYLNYPLETEYFQPLDAMNLKIQRQIKNAFDPENILNQNRLYTSF